MKTEKKKKRRGQSKKGSFVESLLNVFIGFWVAIWSQMLIFPVFDIHIHSHEHIYLGLFFTAVSIVRSYCLRRFFNYLHIMR